MDFPNSQLKFSTAILIDGLCAKTVFLFVVVVVILLLGYKYNLILTRDV